MGLSVSSFYAGGFLHADDIRTLASNVSSIEEQVAMVQDFARQNLLRLNVQKCEIVHGVLQEQDEAVSRVQY